MRITTSSEIHSSFFFHLLVSETIIEMKELLKKMIMNKEEKEGDNERMSMTVSRVAIEIELYNQEQDARELILYSLSEDTTSNEPILLNTLLLTWKTLAFLPILS